MEVMRNIDRAMFRVLRAFKPTRNTLVRVRGGPLKGMMFSIRADNRFVFGTYEPDSMAELTELVGPQDTVYDMGAHHGYYAMAMARLTQGRVHAFEPLPENIRILKRHFDVNQIRNVVLHETAMAKEVGFVDFSNLDATVSNTYIQDSKSFQSAQNRVRVPTTSVDELVFGDPKLEPPNLMKIDVEGAEHDVLQGAARTVDAYHPVILLATHDSHLPGIKDRCLKWMEQHGYECMPTDVGKGWEGHEDFMCRYQGEQSPDSATSNL